jgi:hypothetical protein
MDGKAVRKLVGKNSRALMESARKCLFQRLFQVGCQWLTPVILATQEAKIRRIGSNQGPDK